MAEQVDRNAPLVVWSQKVRPLVSGRYDADVVRLVTSFLNDLHLGGRRTRVLEIGCGDGWLTRALAEAGYDVTGIDADSSIVRLATELSDGLGIKFRRGNVRRLRVRRRFGAVICMGHSLGYQGWGALGEELRACAALVRSGGLLIVDFRNPLSLERDFERAGGIYADLITDGFQIQESLADSVWTLEFRIETEHGELVQRYDACMPSKDIIAGALAPYGGITWFGSYSGRPMHPSSQRTIAVMRRK